MTAKMMVEYPFRKGQMLNKMGREDEYTMATRMVLER